VSSQLTTLPAGLPVPVDDGSAAHLQGMHFPGLEFEATSGKKINLSTIQGRLVIYIYPLTGQPNVALPAGWDEIPGARGCTPQACDFSHHHQQLQSLNATVFGLSSQTTDYQAELKGRLHLPFDLLSDSNFQLTQALNLPTFKAGDLLLYKRLTLIAEAQVIQKVFYPVFPPNQHAAQVIDWLRTH
jgi:peroxiredoxin